MSECRVPRWNLSYQRQEQVGGDHDEENNNTSSSHHHVHNQLLPHLPISSHHLVPMSNYEVTELTWEKGQLAMHGLHSYPTKPTSIWRTPNNDTLESIVHQSTSNTTPTTTATDNNLAMAATVSMKKRARPEYSSKDHHHHHQYLCGGENYSTNYNNNGDDGTSNKDGVVVMSESELEEYVHPSGCGSASYKGTFCRESGDGATMMTWGSFESNPSFKTKTTTDGDSAGSENQDEDRETKSETARSQSSRRGRAAAIHNLSERRRRDRINQKMKALQKLVPNASKTDKASMLDEVIGYLKRLQLQLQSMISLRNNNMLMNMHPHHHIMNMHLHQLHQYSLLARMGMMSMSASAAAPQSLPSPPPPPLLMHPAANPTYVPHPFVVPQMASRLNPEPPATSSSAVPLTDAYCALLAQSMNMEVYNKMAALYLQQVNQNTKARSGAASGSSNHVQDDI